VRNGNRIALLHASTGAIADRRLVKWAMAPVTLFKECPRMMRPDQYYAILSIMRYGSLVLAMLFAGKIVAYAAGLHH
jgi:hypothetical protein